MSDPIQLIVRVRTSYWSDKKKLIAKKEISFLKKKSIGFNFLAEDCQCIGADEVMPRFTNLYEVDDGIYQVGIINEYRDHETGNIEDYDYQLFPYDENATPQPSVEGAVDLHFLNTNCA